MTLGVVALFLTPSRHMCGGKAGRHAEGEKAPAWEDPELYKYLNNFFGHEGAGGSLNKRTRASGWPQAALVCSGVFAAVAAALGRSKQYGLRLSKYSF